MAEGGEPRPRGIPRRGARVGITHLRAAHMVRMNISKGGERGKGRVGRGVWRLNPQNFPHTALKLLFIDPGEGGTSSW